MARLDRAHSGVMSNEGERLRSRRERLAMSKLELAEQAGISRDTLAAIERGEGFRRSSLTKVERVLDELEEEAGIHAPAPAESEGPRLATFDVSGEGGFHIVVSGPIEDADLLKRQVVDIIQAMRKAEQDSDPPSGAG